MNNGWLPIESAPKDETIMIWSRLFGGAPVIVKWDDDRYAKKPVPRWVTRDVIYGRRSFVDFPPTHWQPLPAPPQS